MSLLPGLIFAVAVEAGIDMRGNGDKRAIRCPFHDDRHPSAFLSINNVFQCSVCCPERGWSLKTFREKLGAGWSNPAPITRQRSAPAEPFTAADAHREYSAAFARARDDEFAEADAEVYDYLGTRSLAEAWEVGAFGILSPRPQHPALRRWNETGHRLVGALYDRSGQVVGIQARTVCDARPKTLFPAGSRVAGSTFADRRGQRVLAGELAPVVLLGEGLADSLAYAIASPWPTLTAPGTSLAVQMVGPWARDAEVIVALDADAAGQAAAEPVRDALYRHGARRVRRVRWPSGVKDACDLVALCGIGGLHDFLRALAPSEAA